MEIVKTKKNRNNGEMYFIVKMTHSEYIQTSNFLNQNKDGLVYLGNDTWGKQSVYDKNNDGIPDNIQHHEEIKQETQQTTVEPIQNEVTE